MSNNFNIREASPNDLHIVMHHRRSMFIDMGHHDKLKLDAMETTSNPFFAKAFNDGSYKAWFIEDNGKVIAGGGILIFDYHSSPVFPLPKRPLIVNVYTEKAYRRKGLAKKLMQIMIDWCKNNGFGAVTLHASDEGRPLYEKIGFVPTNEMKLIL